MKTGFNSFLPALAFSTIFVATRSQAADLTWDATTNTTWNTSTANWTGTAFTNGDTAIFSSASTKGALTLGTSISAANLRSNGANTPATTTITGAAGFTLSLGNGTAGSGNIAATDGVSAFEQNINYNMTGTGSAFALTTGSGTSLNPSIWNIASGKTFTLSAGTTGQVADLNGNTVNLTGAGTVRLNTGATLTSTSGTGTINVNAGTLHLSGGSNRATTVNNSVTVNVGPSGTLQMSVNTGTGSTFSQNTNLNGGTLSTSGGTVITVGGTVTLASSTSTAFAFSTGATTSVSSMAGSGEANLTSGTFSLSATYPSFTGNLKVSGGATASLAASAGINHPLTLARSATGRAILTLGSDSIWSGPITVDNTATQTSGTQFASILSGGTTAATASVVSGNIGFSALGSASQPALVLRSGGTFGKVTGSVSLSTGTVQLLDATKWEFSNTSNTWGVLDINNNGAIAYAGAANTLSPTGVVTASNVSGGIGTLKLNNLDGTSAFNQTIAGLSGAVNVGLDTGASTLTLNTSADQSHSGVISGAISLVKSGSAKQTLTGVNTYTGSTTINGGTLALGTTGAISSGNLSISSATLDLRKGTSTRTQTVNDLTLNNATLDIGMNAEPDRIDALGVTTISGTNTLKLYGSLPTGSYDLITSTSTLTGTFNLDTSGVTPSGFPVSYSGSISGGSYVLTVSGAATPYTAYWLGDVSSTWNDASSAPNSNWAANQAGTSDAGQIPGAITDVYFSANSAANTATTLGADISINSLTFETGTASVGGANTLTVLSAFGNGINVLSGADATLNTAIVCSSSTTVQEGGTLTVNGGSLGSGPLIVDGTLYLNTSVAKSSLSGVGTGIISRNTAGTSILTISGTSNDTYAGAINDAAGSISLVKGGSSTLTLSGSGSYTGGTTISGGVLKANASSALGSGTVAINGGQRLSLGDGVTVANPIAIGANTSPQGAGILEGSSTVTTSAALTGPISITNNAAGGGHFINSGSGIFDVKGTITSTVPVVQRNGTVTYWGGGTGYTAMTVTGTARLGANHGLATTATVTIGAAAAGTLDLAGFNQSLAGIVKNASNSATIGNSSTTANSVLTITGTSTFDGVIRDSIGSGTRNVGLIVNGGTLTLGGLNTYTGNTTINSGSLVLADNAQLKFAIGATNGTSNSISGVSATLNGDFNIDTTLADASSLTSGTWTLENVASLTAAYGSTFQVVSGATAWVATGDVWTKTVGAKTYSFDETTGVLTLTSGGFESWIASKGLTGPDAAFDADPDNDGLDNGLEFVLGGEPNPANPGASSASLLPTVSQSAGTMTYTFERKDISESGVALHFQWSTDLTFPSPANDVPVGSVDSTTDTISVDVTEDNPDADTDTIVITVPAAKAAGGKLFGRLKAAKNP